MKILQIVQKPQRRGPEILARQINGEFRRLGHEALTVYLYRCGLAAPLPVEEHDAALDGVETSLLEKIPGWHPGLLSRLASVVGRFAPDVIQLNGSRSLKYGALLSRFYDHLGVMIYRNIDDPSYWIRDVSRLLFYRHVVMPEMDGVIGVSPRILERACALYRLSVPAVAIPYVVDPARLVPRMSRTEARAHLGVAVDAPIVLFVGNLSPQKRPDRFLRVVHQVSREKPGLKAWILGDGQLRQTCEQQVKELGLEETVRFWGYQEGVAPFLSAADVLLVSSDSDGVPTVIQEAGYLSRPTVATSVGGIPECVVDGISGLLCGREDELGLANAVLTLLRQPQMASEMGNRAKAMVEERYTLERVVDSHLDFYRRLVAGS